MLVESFNRTRWLDKLRPAGASQKADGPEGPMAPIVTTGILVVENLLTRHPCAFVRVIFAPEPCNFHCIVTKKLQKRVAPIVLLCRLEKNHATSFHQYLHSRIMRVILAQGSCPVLQILDVFSQRGKTLTMLLFFQKNSMYVSSLHKGPCKFSLRRKKTCN